jgi:UDP-N-acetylglucosamine--N-acetylmuramyl-(pentapeptide) pyrophosphoryl-undecaprenol N-acetylglucosamine transferase
MMIAAGGTGGHIMPALAIGEHLGRVEPDCAIRYVCGARPVELEIYRRAGIEPKVIAVDQLGHGPFGFLASIFKLRRSIAAARAYLREERPAAALGMGGYVCFPAMSAAVGEKVPTLIHESNALAGRANRWLARRVTAVACGYAEAATAFPAAKTRVTGNPVRPEFIGGNRAEALRRWQFREGAPTLLVFGGSQGARRLNQLVLDSLPALDARAESFGGLQLLWSCGERNFVLMEELVRRLALRRTNLTLVPFIREMGLAYAAADLALGRAGAMTVAELTANALPAILVPLPGAVGGHQALNAKPVAEAGAGIVLDESALDGASLARTVGDLFSDRPRLNQMRAAARQIGRPRAVEEIVEMIFGLRGKLP